MIYNLKSELFSLKIKLTPTKKNNNRDQVQPPLITHSSPKKKAQKNHTLPFAV